MARKPTPSFVGEFLLDIDSSAATQLGRCLRAHGNLYNACLGEARNRAQRMREHPSWKAARAMPKKTQEEKKACSAAFAACNRTFYFSAYSLQKFALTCRDACWLKDHIGGSDLQTTSDRAFKAVKHWVLGVHGKPRMKPTRAMRSISGKTKANTIRLRQTSQGQWQVMARGLVLPLLVKSTPKDTYQTDALGHRAKYVRLVRRSLRHKLCWFAQVIFEGLPPTKARHSPQEGIVGIYMGPRTLAVVGPPEAGEAGIFKAQLCPGTERPRRIKRRLARKIDRSRRATNPGNFDERGRAKRGCKWIKSASV